MGSTQKTRNRRISEEIRVGGLELAEWLGLSMSTITAMKTAGKIAQDSDGKYRLKECVRGYISELKERKDKREGGSIEQETAYWKLQNLKQKNRDWRQARDRMVANALLGELASECGRVRERLKGHPDAVAALDELKGAIGSVDVELVAMTVEGGDDDED